MAKRASKGEATKGETITVRISPQSKWALETLARIENKSLSAVVEDAVMRHVKETSAEIYKMGKHNLAAALMGRALLPWAGDESNRVLTMLMMDESVLSYGELRTVRLLENLELLKRNRAKDREIDGEACIHWYDYNPLLIALIWDDTKSAAQDEPPNLAKLEALLGKVREFVTSASETARAVEKITPDRQPRIQAGGGNHGT